MTVPPSPPARTGRPGPPGTLHEDAVGVLTAWQPDDPGQRRLRTDYLDHLAVHGDALSRSNRRGHLTGSALVVDVERERVLLTLHPLVGRWLQLGGHIEDTDTSLVAAALREAREEGGIDEIEVDPSPLRLDRHSVRCRDARGDFTMLDHLDVQFLAIAPTGAVARQSDESLDLRWWAWSALPEDTDASVRSLVATARIRVDA
jgi:8-oxo-dGTP pyrophosphatase MutT (NUDIX family)